MALMNETLPKHIRTGCKIKRPPKPMKRATKASLAPQLAYLLRARVAGDTIRDLIEALQQLDPDLKHGVEEVVRINGRCDLRQVAQEALQ